MPSRRQKEHPPEVWSVPPVTPCIYYAFKEKRKERTVVAKATVQSREVYSGSSLLADWNVQSVSGLYKNFTRMSPSEFEFLINLIGEKNLEKRHSVQESHFCSRKVGTDARFLGTWWFVRQSAVPIQNFQASNQPYRAGSVWSSFWKKLKDYIQGRQRVLFVFGERILKLDCNHNFY